MPVHCNLSTLMGKNRFSIQDVHKQTGLSRNTISNLYMVYNIASHSYVMEEIICHKENQNLNCSVKKTSFLF